MRIKQKLEKLAEAYVESNVPSIGNKSYAQHSLIELLTYVRDLEDDTSWTVSSCAGHRVVIETYYDERVKISIYINGCDSPNAVFTLRGEHLDKFIDAMMEARDKSRDDE